LDNVIVGDEVAQGVLPAAEESDFCSRPCFSEVRYYRALEQLTSFEYQSGAVLLYMNMMTNPAYVL